MVNKLAAVMFPEAEARAQRGLCTVCAETAGSFKDELSEKEFKVSGMCQRCQDRFFNEEVQE